MMKDWNHDLVRALSKKTTHCGGIKIIIKRRLKAVSTVQFFWVTLEQDDEKHVKMLALEIKRHIAEKRFE